MHSPTVPQTTNTITFSDMGPGDAGAILHYHGAVIAPEFGWNLEFDALCAQILADFIRNFQPAHEKSWVARQNGKVVGSLFLIRENEQTARLRLLYVDKTARGLGLATDLLQHSFAFAREKHYRRVVLFTTDSNVGARRIYTKLGMKLVTEEPFDFAGKKQVGETWELELA